MHEGPAGPSVGACKALWPCCAWLLHATMACVLATTAVCALTMTVTMMLHCDNDMLIAAVMFFAVTGLHGSHVMAGTCSLCGC